MSLRLPYGCFCRPCCQNQSDRLIAKETPREKENIDFESATAHGTYAYKIVMLYQTIMPLTITMPMIMTMTLTMAMTLAMTFTYYYEDKDYDYAFVFGFDPWP